METTLPPQPPPDVPAPPPGPEARRSRWKMKAIIAFGLLCAGPGLIGSLIAPHYFKVQKKVNYSIASANIRQISNQLFEFDAVHGKFPDATTIASVQAKTSTTLPLGNSTSNDLFRQLFASGTVTEQIFFAKSPTCSDPGDEILGALTLAKGECGFTYVAGLSSSHDGRAPLIMTPVIPGTWKFDSKPFGGKAIVFRCDGSVKLEPIDPHEHVMIGGMNLFDPRQPYWRGKAPDIKWPE